ncbi:permease-like cell division protein FtsX [Demequina muriae]|uniref:Cell division protein FtsX n=1 Tax=Demequina muriae TaxID=3051664 RepID=A0ABT8GEN0_9MICO|nr:permease-like cell division protein FtsX [Demequina sp. EGI L300058]MDN4479885.1 permease-like cell division protein FtsX [Demequina sp. EGI L300058]
MRIRFILGEVASGLRRNSTMALSVVLVTFVSLTFVGAAALTQMQVQQLRDAWYGEVEVSIFLCPENSLYEQCAAGPVSPDQEDDIRGVLEEGSVADIVDEVYYETREEVFENIVGADETGVYSQLEPADLGPVFRVKLTDPEQFQVVADATEGLPGVEEVNDQREVFDELFRFLNAATFIAAGLAAVMMLAAVLLITTTIRLSALSRRRETTIMRMVGSSKSLIQMPFMLEGAVAATLGAVLAIGGLYLSARYFIEDWLHGSIAWVDYVGRDDVWTVAPWLLAIAVGLAALASLATLGRYTRA